MAPPFIDEDNIEMDLVEQGMGLAEEERRGAINEIYEDSAAASEDPEAALDDVDYTDDESDSRGPEVAAIHEFEIPDDDDDEPVDD